MNDEISTWTVFLRPGEKILESALIGKKNPMGIPLKRQLILTDTPRLFYVDPVSMEAKGEIEWPKDDPVQIEECNRTTIKLSCRGRSYKFIDNKNGSQYWITRIQKAVLRPPVS